MEQNQQNQATELVFGMEEWRSLGCRPSFCFGNWVDAGTNNQDIGDTGQPGGEQGGRVFIKMLET